MVAELGPTMEERAFTYDREASFPCENFRDFHDRGLLALCVPTAYGGLGASFADYVRVSRGDRSPLRRDGADLQHARRHDALDRSRSPTS